MIDVSRLSRTEQTFTFVAVDGAVFHIAVERLNSYLEGIGFEPGAVRLAELYTIAVERNGADQAHADKIPLAAIISPITLIDMDDGTHILVDGTHRVVRFHQQGLPNIGAWIVPSKLWRKFQITGVAGDADTWNAFNAVPGRYHPPKDTIIG